MKTISFMTDMIRAYQRGDKTQTRRIINPQPNPAWAFVEPRLIGDVWSFGLLIDGGYNQSEWKCPYGNPGDLLGFLEGYQITSSAPECVLEGIYLADGEPFRVHVTREEFDKWVRRKCPYRATPGRFMYRSLVRYTPKILSIRVERVQDISDEDILTEGIDPIRCARTEVNREVFSELWDSINSKRGYGWNANPWCWVVEVERN